MADLVPYEQQPQPEQFQLRYTIDFGKGQGPIRVVLGQSGVYIAPSD